MVSWRFVLALAMGHYGPRHVGGRALSLSQWCDTTDSHVSQKYDTSAWNPTRNCNGMRPWLITCTGTHTAKPLVQVGSSFSWILLLALSTPSRVHPVSKSVAKPNIQDIMKGADST